MSIFEIGMLICFGASWPFSLYKTWKTKCSQSKSFIFLWLIIIGYFCGVMHKILYHYDPVIWLYVLNMLLVSSDLALSYRYRNCD
ncbi:MAG: hypothetical protein ABFD49_09605 [Armatimonadota bacterium]|nr:hypothetical protein [bacterium]